jgi:hypothetical protein
MVHRLGTVTVLYQINLRIISSKPSYLVSGLFIGFGPLLLLNIDSKVELVTCDARYGIATKIILGFVEKISIQNSTAVSPAQ